MVKKALAAIATVALALCLAGCTSEANNIDKDISNLGDMTIDSYSTLQDINQRYDALDDKEKQKVENYDALENANKRMNDILYAELSKALDAEAKAENSFFAQYYDTNSLLAAKDAAQKAINSSNADSYYDSLESLNSELELFTDFVNTEETKSYSVQTNNGDYPFAVEESPIKPSWILDPYPKRSSDYPYYLVFIEGTTTDEPTQMTYNIGDKIVCAYDIQIEQTDTSWIDVELPDGSTQKAFVNTKVVLSNTSTNWGQHNDVYQLEGGDTCYMLKTSDGTKLAVKDLVTGNGYILYKF